MSKRNVYLFNIKFLNVWESYQDLLFYVLTFYVQFRICFWINDQNCLSHWNIRHSFKSSFANQQSNQNYLMSH